MEALVEYKGNDFSFEYELGPLDVSNKYIEKEKGYVATIDGMYLWGTDGNMPRIEVKAMNVVLRSKEININRFFYSDIFECSNNFNVYKRGDTYIVYQQNSDGAGSYELVWVINKDGLQQRLVGSMF